MALIEPERRIEAPTRGATGHAYKIYRPRKHALLSPTVTTPGMHRLYWALFVVFWCTLVAGQHPIPPRAGAQCADVVCAPGFPDNCAVIWEVTAKSLEAHDYTLGAYPNNCELDKLDENMENSLATGISANVLARGLAYPTSQRPGRNGYYIVAGPGVISARSELWAKGPGTVRSPYGATTVGPDSWVSVVLEGAIHPSWPPRKVVRSFAVSGRGAVRAGDMSYSLDRESVTTFYPDGKRDDSVACDFIPPVREWGCSTVEYQGATAAGLTQKDEYFTVGQDGDVVALTADTDDGWGPDAVAGMDYARNRGTKAGSPTNDGGGSSITAKTERVGTFSPAKEKQAAVEGDYLPMNGEEVGVRPDHPLDWTAMTPGKTGGYGRVGVPRPQWGHRLDGGTCEYPGAPLMTALDGGEPTFTLRWSAKSAGGERLNLPQIDGMFSCALVRHLDLVATCMDSRFSCATVDGHIKSVWPETWRTRTPLENGEIPLGQCDEFYRERPRENEDLVCIGPDYVRPAKLRIYWCVRSGERAGVGCNAGRAIS